MHTATSGAAPGFFSVSRGAGKTPPVFRRIIDNWIANHEAEKAERVAQGLPANETEALRLENASLREEVARLRGLPAPEGERVIDPPTSDIVPPGEQGRL